ncbi:Aliphatic sulfonates import ATP-binding protein SsuB [Roseobacter fucihabitans]|uniref:Aliphatic sulfonates import ATP-binding protein SsuB n=1 Tax=Roseobacter fucihabitans TaxID=1537242 RepID=A0ABZ2BZ54_9RHOB|nr:ABC transporter ATP-binding protein [Roseobacter litoralis]MBC6966618.1 Aliphatic sulfonates import ATP-binding protein SsuB [Roseobacter litoralis]
MADPATDGTAREPVACAVIRVDVKSKRFGDVLVLGDISFTIAKGETLALVGPSGIGKSTLLRILSGVDHDFEGTVIRPDAMAFVFQEPTLLPWRSALQNLLLVHPRLSATDARERMAEVGLAGKELLFPGQLSLGQQRRLSLARAFAGQPELLIMDEPYASLDSDTGDAMLRLTEALIARHRPASLFVTHDMREADRLADRVLTLCPHATGATLN